MHTCKLLKQCRYETILLKNISVPCQKHQEMGQRPRLHEGGLLGLEGGLLEADKADGGDLQAAQEVGTVATDSYPAKAFGMS